MDGFSRICFAVPMLKIAFWRLTFEVLHFFKLLGFRGSETSYFAYGGNLDPQVLKNRGIRPTHTSPETAKDFVLRFNHDVPFVGIGMASIEKQEGSSVHGIVYQLSKVDEWILDCYEAHLFFSRYRKAHLVLNGKKCFYYYSGRTGNELLPSKAYLQKLVNGYKTFLPSDSPFISQLESHPSLPQMIPRKPPRFLFSDYAKFGRFLRPLIEMYDQACVRVFVFFIFRPALFRTPEPPPEGQGSSGVTK